MPKILVAIWEPLVEELNQKVEAACLRRDNYLDRVLRHEAAKLREEVPKRNSDLVRGHIARHLALLRRKPVNLSLSEETARSLSEVCEDRNVPRDAFVNRVILLLVGTRELFRRLLTSVEDDDAEIMDDDISGWLLDNAYNVMADGSLNGIVRLANRDPFRYVRSLIECALEKKYDAAFLHALAFERDALADLGAASALGFNCCLDEDEIEELPKLEEPSEARIKLFGRPQTAGQGETK